MLFEHRWLEETGIEVVTTKIDITNRITNVWNIL